MDATKVDKAAESAETAPIEAEVPAPGEMEAEFPAENIVPLVNKVAVPPLAEMDKLIDEAKRSENSSRIRGRAYPARNRALSATQSEHRGVHKNHRWRRR